MSELERKFHKTWLGMVQPTEGLVVSMPVLVDAQVMDRTKSIEHQQALLGLCPPTGKSGPLRIADLGAFLTELLGVEARRYDASAARPEALSLYVPEGPQTLVPTLAVRKAGKPAKDGDGNGDADIDAETDEHPAVRAGRAYQMLVWDLAADPKLGGAGPEGAGLSLDKPETLTGKWDYPPAAKFDRLLRHCRVPIGLLTNREVLRLVYAPHGESSGSITFRIADMAETAGRPILDAFVGLLNKRRLFVLGEDRRLPALLAESRQRQANVTNELADQVFEALEALLRGFEAAAEREGSDHLDAALARDDDHLYGGLLTVLLRLVFLLYAEDRGLMPVEHDLYARHMSVLGMFERLQADAGAHPDSMHRRFGAWDRLLATWRAVYLGVEHGELRMPPRHGQLFDPHLFPFIEGWGPAGSAPIIQAEARAEVCTPSVDDETVLTVLEKLLIFQGQRLSYRALDVEQIGSVYEALMGYHAVRLEAPAVCLKPQRARKVWLSAAEVLAVPQSSRGKWLKEEIGITKAHSTKLAKALDSAKASTEVEVLAVLDAHALKGTQRAARGRVVLQPGQERRRTSSHYTPRSLTAPIVQRTLEPLIAAMGEAPSADLLLSLKICDPAMGSGAFLVEVCRQLAEYVVAAWTREEGKLAEIAKKYGDPIMHARRVVAQRCVYGVDKNPFAVNLAKLSLWLVTLAKGLPFTFVDHALRHGDSLVGLGFDQIRVFHWKPDAKQQELFAEEIRAALDEAVGLREEICDLAEDDSFVGVREKERLLRDAEDALSRVRLIADVIVGAFFAEDKAKAREMERVRRLGLVGEWLRSGLAPTEELLGMQAVIRGRTPVFHWMVEFPEVFYAERPDPLEQGEVNRAAFMDAFVGNPPFAGKNMIISNGGRNYLPWLLAFFSGSLGNSDLSAFFVRQAVWLIGEHGIVSMITKATIAFGDTRSTGLQWVLAQSWIIYFARPKIVWGGEADTVAAIVCLAKGTPSKHVVVRLEGERRSVINSRLRPTPERADPASLSRNSGVSFTGSYILGDGFFLSLQKERELEENDLTSSEVIFDYVGGQEFNASPALAPARRIISFGHMNQDEASAYAKVYQHVLEEVKPVRAKNGRASYRKYWWLHAERRVELYETLRKMRRCLVTSQASPYLSFGFQPTDRVFGHTTYVIALDEMSGFSIIQSIVHGTWASLLSSMHGGQGDVQRYRASEVNMTFPFPQPDPRTKIPALYDIGERLYDTRAAYMIATDQGLTKTYNKLKDLTNDDPEILELRRLHEELDRKVLDAYGWSDIEVPAYGTPTTHAGRKAFEAFEDEVIDRLFVLNAERAAEEERLGLSTRGKKKASKKPKKDDGGQQSLL